MYDSLLQYIIIEPIIQDYPTIYTMDYAFIKQTHILFTLVDKFYTPNVLLSDDFKSPWMRFVFLNNILPFSFQDFDILMNHPLMTFFPKYDWLMDESTRHMATSTDCDPCVMYRAARETRVPFFNIKKQEPIAFLHIVNNWFLTQTYFSDFIYIKNQGASSLPFFNHTSDNIKFLSLLTFLPILLFKTIDIPFTHTITYYNNYISANTDLPFIYENIQLWQNITFLIFILPLILILLIIIINNKKQLKQLSFTVSFIIFFLTLLLFLNNHINLLPTLSNSFNFWYYFGFNDLNFETYYIKSFLSCQLSFDNFNILFILLSTFLITITNLLSWNLKLKHIKIYLILLSILNWLLILSFSTQNIFIFFTSFESTLIPMFLLIFIWGSRERKLRAFYLLLYYTLVSSILMLLALIIIYQKFHTFNFYIIYTYMHTLPLKLQIFIFIAFFLTFASKIPMYPLHSWLPEAHVEAPTSGSVLLAGILLKIGVFALIKYILILFPTLTYHFSPIIISLAITSLILSSFSAIRQNDLKRIIAYSSIAHMNLIVIGIFIFSTESILGAIFQSISHGFVASALFILIGILYDRYHTRLIYYYSGLIRVMPIFTIFFIFFTLANIAFPGTSNFMGEMILIFGIGLKNYIIAIISSIGIVLSGTYSLWLTNRISFGNISTQFISFFIDVSKRELLILILFSVLTLVFGIYPTTNILNYQFITDFIIYNLT